MSSEQKPLYGGQAVVEGVMFGGKHHYVTAIRRKDQSVDYFHLPRTYNTKLAKLKKFRFYEVSLLLLNQVGMGQSI